MKYIGCVYAYDINEMPLSLLTQPAISYSECAKELIEIIMNEMYIDFDDDLNKTEFDHNKLKKMLKNHCNGWSYFIKEYFE